MTPRIETIPEKKLVGIRTKVTLSTNKSKTSELWQQFMPKRKDITNRVGTVFYSIQLFDETIDFKDFNPHTEFEKWAVVEVSNFEKIVPGMETYTMVGGEYAVFIHKGPASTFYKTSQYIFETWLPKSKFELDKKREHFEILNEGYNPNDPNSEEEVWIPIKDNGKR